MTNVHLYNVYILPVLLYDCETRTTTDMTLKKLDAFKQWCLRCILRIPYMRYTTNVEVRVKAGQIPASELVLERLRFYGHVARTNPNEDHHRAVKPSKRVEETERQAKDHLDAFCGKGPAVFEHRPPQRLAQSAGQSWVASSRGHGYAPLKGLPMMMIKSLYRSLRSCTFQWQISWKWYQIGQTLLWPQIGSIK